MTVENYKNGVPLPSCAVSISSFNLLAPLYIRPIDTRTGQIQPFAAFDWISKEDSDKILGDKVRLPKLLKRLQNCGSDFICVQELQLERKISNNLKEDIHAKKATTRRSRKEDCDHNEINAANISSYSLPEWILPLVASDPFPMGSSDNCTIYSVVLPDHSELQKMGERNQRVLRTYAAVTNAIFYRSDKWRPVSTSGSDGSTTNCVMQGFVPIELGNRMVDPLVVVSIHLDARSEEKRVQQLQRCLELCIKYSGRCVPPIIIAGDYNCEQFRGSCVHEFLDKDNDHCKHELHCGVPTEQDIKNECAKALRLSSMTVPNKVQMKSWDDLRDTASNFVHDNCFVLKRIDTGNTRVAYNHDDELTENASTDAAVSVERGQKRGMEKWHLDHIVYTSLTLNPIAKWSTLEDDEYSTRVGLPNAMVPTDHLPIAAAFHMKSSPQLDDETRTKLTTSCNELETRQRLELDKLQKDMDIIRTELEQKQAAKNEDNENENQRSKKAKKKPPPVIIDHIRNSRATKKQLKEKHRAERHNFIKDLAVLERMELQYLFNGISCRSWAENGRD